LSLHAVTIDSPLGPVTAVLSAAGVRALGFTGRPADLEEAAEPLEADEVGERLGSWFAGDLRALADLPLDVDGTPLTRAVWRALRDVPAGETASYASIARRCGLNSPRAAGAACARNPVSLLIPCHRAVGSDGALRGYRWGLERKAWLQEHERRFAAA